MRVLTWLGVLATLGCTELAEIPAKSCGNGVVEQGEDCDSFGSDGCVSCRFACSKSTGNPSCPQDFLCGSDNICRKPLGAYETLRVPELSYELFSGKFQTTERDSLWSRGPLGALHTFDRARRLSQTLRVPGSMVQLSRHSAAVLRIDGDALDDAVLTNPNGNLEVFLGHAQRGLTPHSFTEFQELPPGRLLAAVTMRPHRPDLIYYVGKHVYVKYDAVAPFDLEYQLELSHEEVANRIGVGNVDTSLSDELALAKPGDTRVLVAKLVLNGEDAPIKDTTASWVTLPDGMQVNWGAEFAEIDGNAHLDLIVGARNADDTSHEVLVAYGVGDGTFHSDDAALPASNGDGKFSPRFFIQEKDPDDTAKVSSPVIAVGNLNNDAFSDFVLAGGQFMLSGRRALDDYDTCYGLVSVTGPWKCQQGIVPRAERLESASIADFNGNGLPDVIAVNTAFVGFDFLNGTGKELFNQTVITFDGLIHTTPVPVVGDFDGDVIADLAFTFAEPSSSNIQLALLFGNNAGTPTEIARLGALGNNPQLAAGHTNFDVQDAVSDLLALWPEESGVRFSVYDGRSDRHPYSPFTLTSKSPEGVSRRNIIDAVMAGTFAGSALGEVATISRPWIKEDFTMVHQLSPIERVSRASQTLPAYVAYDYGLDPEQAGLSMTSLDLDADGKQELVLFGYPELNQISVLRLQAETWAMDSPVSVPNATNLRTRSALADFDQDGLEDVLVRNIRDRATEFFLFRTGGKPLTFTAPTLVPVPGAQVFTFRVLNAIGDATPELLIPMLQTVPPIQNQLSIMRINPSTWTIEKAMPDVLVFPPAMQTETELTGSELANFEIELGLTTGDFDGNGLDDFALGGVELNVFFAKSTQDEEPR